MLSQSRQIRQRMPWLQLRRHIKYSENLIAMLRRGYVDTLTNIPRSIRAEKISAMSSWGRKAAAERIVAARGMMPILELCPNS